MSTPQNGSGGANQIPGGNPDPANDPNKPTGGEPPKSPTVSREAHEKLLDEKKSLSARLQELEAREKARETEEAKKTNDYKKLLEIKEKELKETSEKYGGLRGTIEKSVKRQAFLNAVNGKVDEKLYPLLDLDKIVLDPETGVPDELSVQRAAKEFETQYGQFLIKEDPNRPKMPNAAAPGAAGVGLTYEEWLKLPAKDMAKRIGEVNK